MGGDGVRQQAGLHQRQRAPAPVERVRARVGVADGVEPEGDRGAVRGAEAAQPVDEPAHGPHAVERGEGPVGEELGGARQQPARLLEAVGVAEDPAQVAVGRPHRQGDRQRVAVARHPEVLEVAEVAAELGVDGDLAGRQPVPAGHVDEPAGDDRLGHVGADVGQPGHDLVAPAGGGDHDVGGHHRAVVEADPVDARRARPRSPARPTARPPPRRRAARPRARRAAARRSTQSKVVRRMTRTTRSSSPGCGSPRSSAAGRVVHPTARRSSSTSGNRCAQLGDDAGEEAVGLVRLRRPLPLGRERRLGVVDGRGAVALEHGDLVAGSAERQRGGEPADAASDDHDPQRGRRSPFDHVLPLTGRWRPGRRAGLPHSTPLGNDRCQDPRLW